MHAMAKTILIISMLSYCFLLSSCNRAAQKQTPDERISVEKEDVAPVFHASPLESRQNTPFSDGVQVGNTFYLTGQIGRDHAKGALVEGGIEAETKQTLENIKAVLAHHDMTMADVVKALVILDDIEDFAAFNAIYTTYLPQKPARTTFAAESLAAGAKIAIEVIAVKQE